MAQISDLQKLVKKCQNTLWNTATVLLWVVVCVFVSVFNHPMSLTMRYWVLSCYLPNSFSVRLRVRLPMLVYGEIDFLGNEVYKD